MTNLVTQFEKANAGLITPEMRRVAEREFLSPETVRETVAAGHAVIPANIHHPKLDPMGIGRAFTTKINANIGNSSLSSCPTAEIRKLEMAVQYGADTVMDLSTGANIIEIRQTLIAHSKIPLGTVPVYEIIARCGGKVENMTHEMILQVIREQAEQGVDYMTVHCGILRSHLPAALKRKLKIVSRGGSLLAKWMTLHQKENPFYTLFDEILAICRTHDVTLSLGDGLRPGCLADASDAAQFAELDVLGELVFRCRKAGVQVMVEGPGHVPFNEIEMNMKREQDVCGNAPFYVLGPVVIDCAPGYDHLTSAIGATAAAYYGASMLCYVTPKEHLGLPNAEDVRAGVIAYKIAAHAADVALKRPHAIDRDNAISDARAAFDWEAQFDLALDPEQARSLRREALDEQRERNPESAHTPYCTMCGPDFCSMRISGELCQKKD